MPVHSCVPRAPFSSPLSLSTLLRNVPVSLKKAEEDEDETEHRITKKELEEFRKRSKEEDEKEAEKQKWIMMKKAESAARAEPCARVRSRGPATRLMHRCRRAAQCGGAWRRAFLIM